MVQRNIHKLEQGQYDVLVIGGGINGAAVTHMAALNGLKTALLEKDDFASGTSSKSTKLIHGGLRYLENFEFGLVRESLRERAIQLKSAPHIVKPLRFVVPVYQSDKRPLWMMRLGVWLYDFLGGSYGLEPHEALSVTDVCAAIPGICPAGLIGGVAFSDAQMNDARLCLENVLMASSKGADVANYVKVQSFIQENGRAVGVRAYDQLSRKTFEVSAKKIVCAVGPWTNIFLRKENKQARSQVRTTKGIHVVYKGKIAEKAVLISTQNDRRVFFIIPWMGNSLIGTTDTDFEGHPDKVGVDEADIDYLEKEAQRVFPDIEFKKDHVIATFAGLRPLVRQEGVPSKVSRNHVIKESYSGMIYVMGGKYTTYRKIAEDVLHRLVTKSLVDTSKIFPVYGSGLIRESAEAAARPYGLEPGLVKSLMNYYGVRFKDVLALIERDASLKEKICTCSNVIRAQIVYAIESEMAQTEEDIIMRRLTLGYRECSTHQCQRAIKEMMMVRNNRK